MGPVCIGRWGFSAAAGRLLYSTAAGAQCPVGHFRQNTCNRRASKIPAHDVGLPRTGQRTPRRRRRRVDVPQSMSRGRWGTRPEERTPPWNPTTPRHCRRPDTPRSASSPPRPKPPVRSPKSYGAASQEPSSAAIRLPAAAPDCTSPWTRRRRPGRPAPGWPPADRPRGLTARTIDGRPSHRAFRHRAFASPGRSTAWSLLHRGRSTTAGYSSPCVATRGTRRTTGAPPRPGPPAWPKLTRQCAAVGFQGWRTRRSAEEDR